MAEHVRIGVLGAARITPAAVVKPARDSSAAVVVAAAANASGLVVMEAFHYRYHRAIGGRGEMRVLNPLAPQFPHLLSVRANGNHRVERFARRSSYAYQLDAFTDAVLHGKPFPTTADDAVANMALVDAVYRAAGLPVRLPS